METVLIPGATFPTFVRSRPKASAPVLMRYEEIFSVTDGRVQSKDQVTDFEREIEFEIKAAYRAGQTDLVNQLQRKLTLARKAIREWA